MRAYTRQAISGTNNAGTICAGVMERGKCRDCHRAPASMEPVHETMRLDRVNPRTKRSSAVRVVIETSRGCRNKYSYEPEEQVFILKKTLPEGHVFPFDFGFVPRTKAEDGDPVDVLLLMDAPTFPGCVVETRI